MAIAFDSSSVRSNSWVVGTSLTWSHTCTGSDLCLVVAVAIAAEFVNTTGVTYNGVAMTYVNIVSNSPGNNGYALYYLSAPATGAHNVVVSFSGNTSYADGFACSYTGVKQTSNPEDNTTSTNSGGSSVTATLNVTTPNSWLVGFSRGDYGVGTPTITPGVYRQLITGNGLIMFDSNSTVSSGSQSITVSDGGNQWTIVALSIAPSVASNTSNFFNFF